MQRFPRVLLTYNQFRAPPKFLFSFLFFFSPLPLRFLNPDRFADLFAQRGGRAGGRGGEEEEEEEEAGYRARFRSAPKP
jgi:hypothetical protein